MSEDGINLRLLYEAADQLRVQLDSLQVNSEQYQGRLHEAISKYEQCREFASKVSLFSSNESVDDISTNDLRYMAVDYHLGDLTARNFTRDRRLILEKAQDAYTRYLNRLDDYGLLSKDGRALWKRYMDDKDSFSILTSNDPSVRRNAKITRFQQEKELKQKIQYLTNNPGAEEDDDTMVRDLRLAEMFLQTHQTFQALDMIAQEFKILSLAPPSQPDRESSGNDTRHNTHGNRDDYSERLDRGLASMLQNGKTGPLLSKSGRPLQPFTLLDSRQRLRNGVFRPGHNLPTMTIDEYLEEERKRGGIIEGGGEPPIVEPNEDDLEAADRETMKAREWDEFVEANPKGSGNTLNRG